MTTITVIRTVDDIDIEIKVEVEGEFYRGELPTKDSPGESGYVEFRAAYVDGEPFELTDSEKEDAEREMLRDIKNELPLKWQKNGTYEIYSYL
jgi:hypothetical protein